MNNKPIEVIEIVINNRCIYGGQKSKVIGSPLKCGSVNLILSRQPEFVYHRNGNMFYAIDGDFLSIYERQPGTKDAFGGRSFELKMIDGSTYVSTGDLWDPFSTQKFKDLLGFDFCSIGISSEKNYRDCPVFCHAHVKSQLVIDLLEIDYVKPKNTRSVKSIVDTEYS